MDNYYQLIPVSVPAYMSKYQYRDMFEAVFQLNRIQVSVLASKIQHWLALIEDYIHTLWLCTKLFRHFNQCSQAK